MVPHRRQKESRYQLWEGLGFQRVGRTSLKLVSIVCTWLRVRRCDICCSSFLPFHLWSLHHCVLWPCGAVSSLPAPGGGEGSIRKSGCVSSGGSKPDDILSASVQKILSSWSSPSHLPALAPAAGWVTDQLRICEGWPDVTMSLGSLLKAPCGWSHGCWRGFWKLVGTTCE